MSQMPDKIWLHKDTKYSTSDIVSAYQYEFAREIEDEGIENFVEYVNKKAFIDKACEWLESNVEKYIYNDTPSYPDADFKACVGGKCWEYFRKAMEI